MDSVLVQDVVSLVSRQSAQNASNGGVGGFSPGVGFKQTIGMALEMQIDNSSSNTQQPWDGIMVSGVVCSSGSG